jgi:hypothetical protein
MCPAIFKRPTRTGQGFTNERHNNRIQSSDNDRETIMATRYVLLFAALAVLGWFAARSDPARAAETPAPRRPILLELFTSEGCSSCPPADRLLETFDRTRPVSGADLIVLSEHVDYWNRLGWTDPYSSPLFTERQQEYVRQLHLDGAYTPQLVIDGQADFVGSDERAIRAGIQRTEHGPKPPSCCVRRAPGRR